MTHRPSARTTTRVARTAALCLAGFAAVSIAMCWPSIAAPAAIGDGPAAAAETQSSAACAESTLTSPTPHLREIDERTLLGDTLILTPDRPLVTTAVDALTAGADPSTILSRLIGDVRVDADGELVASLSINGQAAVQVIIRRTGQTTTLSYLGLVGGTQDTDTAADQAAAFDYWNVAPYAAEPFGRTLVTVRVEPNGDLPYPRFRLRVSPQTAIVATPAAEDELTLRFGELERDLDGALRVPVRLVRRGGWDPQDADVCVRAYRVNADAPQETGKLAQETVAHLEPDQTSAVLHLGKADAAATYRLEASVSNRFNHPQTTALVGLPARDWGKLSLGLAMLTFGAGALVVAWFRRGPYVWPVVAVVVGVAITGTAASSWGSVTMGEVQVVTPEEAPTPQRPGTFSAQDAARFDDMLRAASAGALVRQSHAQIVEERHEAGLVRVYELNPTQTSSLLSRPNGISEGDLRVLQRAIKSAGGEQALTVGTVSAPVVRVRMTDDGRVELLAGYAS